MMHFNTQMAILTFSKMVDTGDSMTEVLVLIRRILRFPRPAGYWWFGCDQNEG